MELPVYIDGAREGTLRLTKQGALTRAEAELRDVGRVLRLRVFGETEIYLGIPEPRDGRMVLERTLRRVPSSPLYCAEERLTETSAEPDAPASAGSGRRVVWLGGRPHYF